MPGNRCLSTCSRFSRVRRLAKVLERIEFDFDDNGEPELASMISDRDISTVVPQAPASVGV